MPLPHGKRIEVHSKSISFLSYLKRQGQLNTLDRPEDLKDPSYGSINLPEHVF